MERKSGFHPEDDLEVMRPEHFILPACFLLGGLTASTFIFLCEIFCSKKIKEKNTLNHDIENQEEDNTITPPRLAEKGEVSPVGDKRY